MKIGVFDSGLGGLSVLKEIIEVLPRYDYIYLGDNARVPYGEKSHDLIYEMTKNAVDYLFKKDCELVILACNTATSNALRRLQKEYLPKTYPQRRILGVIRPVVESVLNSNFHSVGVMATQATVDSQSYVKEIKKQKSKTNVTQVACPLLVPLIEEGDLDWIGLDLILDTYSKLLIVSHIDALILGCTHYALIEEKIKTHFPPSVEIISQGKETAKKLKIYLKNHPEIEKNLSKNSKRKYLVTDLNKRYTNLATFFMGKSVSLTLASY